MIPQTATFSKKACLYLSTMKDMKSILIAGYGSTFVKNRGFPAIDAYRLAVEAAQLDEARQIERAKAIEAEE